MKRGDILYPHAFMIASAIAFQNNSASIRDICKIVGSEGPAKHSLHQILRHMAKKGYVGRAYDIAREYRSRVQWFLTNDGIVIVKRTRRYYEFALRLRARPDQGNGGVVDGGSVSAF
jgi:hypothetical protein